MPARYEPVALLGKGGGGEVWAIRDRVTKRDLALKVLAEDAGEAEVMALVREAVTLSGLEGLGVPHVLAFGRLPGSTRRFLVRELVDGRSLEEVITAEAASGGGSGSRSERARDWLVPLASAADQLTVLHRAGLLHGDIKPANVIVGADGMGTLVDLGLATPWREGGARARGLTPKYAAPELLLGEPLTVRAEVYALGATLKDALESRGRADLDEASYDALTRIATHATEENPQARYPSVDELGSALKSAAKIETRALGDAAAWPVLGADAAAQTLAGEVSLLGQGQGLAIVGPRRSGRSTLANRLSWSLGVSGAPVASIEPSRDATVSSLEAVELELEAWEASTSARRHPHRERDESLVVVIDDLGGLDAAARTRIRRAAEEGARIVAVGDEDAVAALAPRGVRTFVVPPLDDASATELVKRAIPSLPDRLAKHLLDRTGRRPGLLRSFVKRLDGRAVTSTEEVDEILDMTSSRSISPASRSREEALTELVRALDTGRFDVAAQTLDGLEPPTDDQESVDFAVARSKIFLARGDAVGSAKALDDVAIIAAKSASSRVWQIARARTFMRSGNSGEAARLTEAVIGNERDAITADALSVHGLALAFIGDEANAKKALEEAVAIAREVQDARIEAVAQVSLAIAHQRGGRGREAREAYEAALASAERARDAWTLATARLNLAGLAKADGDLAQALVHLEGALDMGRRAGGFIVVQQALFNLANLDLYLGRYARAAASIEKLAEQRDKLAPNARAQLLGLQAEHATRMGEIERGSRLYDLCAEAYEAVGRPLDAAEARLEGILTRLGGAPNELGRASPERDVAALSRELDALKYKLGDGGFQEHEALAGIVRGSLALARGDEALAREALDEAHERAVSAGQREWAWRALETRARLSAAQGAAALARRDTDASLAMLEESASKLPRDLREVFWNDPRRRSLRQAHTATMPAVSSAPWTGIGAIARGVLGEQGRTPTITGALSGRTASITSMGTPMPAEDRLQRIFEITRDLAREHDLDRLLQRVTDHAVGLLGAERGLIVVVNERGDLVARPVFGGSRDGTGEETHQNFSRSVAERVIRDGEPVIATSARDDERLAQAVSVHQLMIQSIACVPIRGAPPAGPTIGALYLETRLRTGLRFRDELPTLAAFADQAAIAIEGARLLAELRRRSEELEKANAELEEAKKRLAERLGARTEQLASARRDLKQARQELRGHFGYAGLVGTSAAMRKVYALIDRIKDADVPVLITGESGTGKEVIAKAVHTAGPRSKSPFLGVNCGAIPANLLESELFGHVRGAFTGAERDRKGLFREAEHGTLLLDEIGELPTKMQAGLLRVLQEKTVRPVGGAKEETCNARVIAATNRDLSQMVAEGTFREDLFYRLHVIELKVPPLRERSDDIPALIDHFLTLFSSRHNRERKSVERTAVRRLQAYEWPGNVRQLEHVLLNAWLLSEDDEITAEDLDLPAASTRSAARETARGVASSAAVRVRTEEEHKDVEKEKILAALARCNWNRVQAAKMIGIPRRTFYRRLKEYGIV
jgi:transcriptional regulator with GAF, ATPase, and Fis domain/serine/threonine protein kinase